MTFHQQPVPCPPPWWQPASECFDQVKQFEEMLQAMVDKTVDEKLKQLYQQGALPPGVVDGSNAKPGQVGEFITSDIEVPFAAYPAFTDTTVSLTVVPAGDWDIRVSMFSGVEPGQTHPTYLGGYSSWVDPKPAGLSHDMSMGLTTGTGLAGATAEEIIVLHTQVARANFTVPTLIPMRVVVNQSPDPALMAGRIELHFEGRRVR